MLVKERLEEQDVPSGGHSQHAKLWKQRLVALHLGLPVHTAAESCCLGIYPPMYFD